MSAPIKQMMLDYVLLAFKQHKITYYEVANNTSLTEAGVGKVLKGISKNPHTNTIKELYDYISSNYSIPMLANSVNDSKKEEIKLKKTTPEEQIISNLELFMDNKIKAATEKFRQAHTELLETKFKILTETHLDLLRTQLDIAKKLEERIENLERIKKAN